MSIHMLLMFVDLKKTLEFDRESSILDRSMVTSYSMFTLFFIKPYFCLLVALTDSSFDKRDMVL